MLVMSVMRHRLRFGCSLWRLVLATRWRGVPAVVTVDVGILVPPGDDAALVAALLKMRDQPPLPAACRERYLSHYTLERHLTSLAAALSQVT